MRTPPSLRYNGLTLVLSNPSRFDTKRLLSANAGVYVNNECLQPETNVSQCDIRTADCADPYLPSTRVVMPLGDVAMQQLLSLQNSIGEVRGSVYQRDFVYISSFFPQDAVDFKDWESDHNPLRVESEWDDENGDYESDKRHHGVTSRSNYGFWLRADIKKALRILKDGTVKPPYVQANYHIQPSYSEISQFLRDTKSTDLFFDIETDLDLHITCFAISSPDSSVFVVPLLDWNYTQPYPTPRLLRDLAIAVRDNRLVAHNGHAFDFIVLPYKYGIPLGDNLYDTLLAHHRCFPVTEKSLGHCTSFWTDEPFHKDESNFAYNTPAVCQQLWQYCGKDVHTMRLIKRGIDEFATRIPGLSSSITQAMAAIKPYITMTLQGFHIRDEMRAKVMKENDRLMTHYLRWAPMLVGNGAAPYIKGASKKGMLGSSDQAVRYFHDLLNYPVVQRSKKTGEPSLAKKAMYKLKLKHNNPVIDLCLKYRAVSHESGMLKFPLWKTAPDAEQQTMSLNTISATPLVVDASKKGLSDCAGIASSQS